MEKSELKNLTLVERGTPEARRDEIIKALSESAERFLEDVGATYKKLQDYHGCQVPVPSTPYVARLIVIPYFRYLVSKCLDFKTEITAASLIATLPTAAGAFVSTATHPRTGQFRAKVVDEEMDLIGDGYIEYDSEMVRAILYCFVCFIGREFNIYRGRVVVDSAAMQGRPSTSSGQTLEATYPPYKDFTVSVPSMYTDDDGDEPTPKKPDAPTGIPKTVPRA